MAIRWDKAQDAEEINLPFGSFVCYFTVYPDGRNAGVFLASIEIQAIRSYILNDAFQYFAGPVDGWIVGVPALWDEMLSFHLLVAQPFQDLGLRSKVWAHEAACFAFWAPFSCYGEPDLHAVHSYERFGFVGTGRETRISGIASISIACRGGVGRQE